MTPASVMWHDVEYGSYTADLTLWEELAGHEAGPILEVGAGTGRVTLHLARAGHRITALDHDPQLLAALAERAGELDGVETVTADAVSFDVGRGRFGLIIVPMQTIQLLAGIHARRAFLARARHHLRPGGLVAVTVVETLEAFDAEHAEPPLPDTARQGAWQFVSQPVAVRERPATLRIERIRQTIAPSGELAVEANAIELARVTVAELEAEGRRAGLTPEPARRVEETDEHASSDVVMLRG